MSHIKSMRAQEKVSHIWRYSFYPLSVPGTEPSVLRFDRSGVGSKRKTFPSLDIHATGGS